METIPILQKNAAIGMLSLYLPQFFLLFNKAQNAPETYHAECIYLGNQKRRHDQPQNDAEGGTRRDSLVANVVKRICLLLPALRGVSIQASRRATRKINIS